MGSVTATSLGLSAGLLPPTRVEMQLTQSLLQSCRILSAGVHLDAGVGATELFFLEFLDLGRVRAPEVVEADVGRLSAASMHPDPRFAKVCTV